MEEIKVNDYIRTIDGYIRKIGNINTDKNIITRRGKYILDMPYKNSQSVVENKIVKHSINIKDLVQAGDIILYNVNSKITDIEIVKEHIDARTQEKTLRVELWSLEQVEIKEILTKEQYNSMKYIVGG